MPTKRPPKPSFVDINARRHMIAVEAYILAEKRGFAPGGEVEDWISAERIIDQRLTSKAVSDVPDTRTQRQPLDSEASALTEKAKPTRKGGHKTQQTARTSTKRESLSKSAPKP